MAYERGCGYGHITPLYIGKTFTSAEISATHFLLQPVQILLMDVVVIFHKEQICQGENGGDGDQIAPVPGRGIRDDEHHHQRNRHLQSHIDKRHRHVAHIQLICHQLISMFAMRLPKILMQHNTMDNGTTAINPINDANIGFLPPLIIK